MLLNKWPFPDNFLFLFVVPDSFFVAFSIFEFPKSLTALLSHSTAPLLPTSCCRLGKRQLRVEAGLGLSHHYRVCEYGGHSCTKQVTSNHTFVSNAFKNISHSAQESVRDGRALRWAPQLLQLVRVACGRVFGPSEGCPPAPPPGNPF